MEPHFRSRSCGVEKEINTCPIQLPSVTRQPTPLYSHFPRPDIGMAEKIRVVTAGSIQFGNSRIKQISVRAHKSRPVPPTGKGTPGAPDNSGCPAPPRRKGRFNPGLPARAVIASIQSATPILSPISHAEGMFTIPCHIPSADQNTCHLSNPKHPPDGRTPADGLLSQRSSKT